MIVTLATKPYRLDKNQIVHLAVALSLYNLNDPIVKGSAYQLICFPFLQVIDVSRFPYISTDAVLAANAL